MSPDEDTRETPNRPLSRKAPTSPLGDRGVSPGCLSRDTCETCMEPRSREGLTGVREVTLESTWRDSSETSMAAGHPGSPARPVRDPSGASVSVTDGAGETPVTSAGVIGRAPLGLGRLFTLVVSPTLWSSHPMPQAAGEISSQVGTTLIPSRLCGATRGPSSGRSARSLPAQRLPEGPGQLERSGSCLTGLRHFLVLPPGRPTSSHINEEVGRSGRTRKCVGSGCAGLRSSRGPAHHESVLTNTLD